MSCKTETQEIGNAEYTCTQYPAIQSMKYKLKVVKLLGGALGAILPALNKDEDDQSSALSLAVKELFANTTPDEIVDLMVEMMTTGHLKRHTDDGSKRMTKTLFEEVYSGDDLMEAYKVFMFLLKVNYAGFFKGQKATELLTRVEESL